MASNPNRLWQFLKLQFRPGIVRDTTDYSGEGGWFVSQLVRFFSGYPQNIGGWVKAAPDAFYGVCRQMWNWVTTFGDNLLSLGTSDKLYLEVAGVYYDITPLRLTLVNPNTNNSINTTITSYTVVVNLGTVHGAADQSFVTISGSTAVGGVPAAQINANHRITVIDTDSFSFTVATAATSTVASGGGTGITMYFEIAPGRAIAQNGYGWGVGTWGRDSWGTGTSEPLVLPQQDWWLDNFDNDLVASIRDGPIYWWERGTDTNPSTALATRAVLLSTLATSDGFDPNAVPVKVMQTLVSQNDKHLIAFGAVPFGSTDVDDFDPLLIRWADQDNPTQWTPDVTNSSGFLRISRGSRIVRALPTRQEILVWSDSNLYSLQFLGTTDVFGLQEYADTITIVSPRACATAAGITYWMGHGKFYTYTGRVDTLKCDLTDHVFQNLNYGQLDQIICGVTEEWTEVWWYYPSASSSYIDSYVIYNYKDQVWYYGMLERTTWYDTPVRQYVLATTYDPDTDTGFLYNQETGMDADGAVMECYVQTNDFDIGDGYDFMLCTRLIPDVDFTGSTATTPEVTMEIRARDFPGTGFKSDAQDAQRVVQTSVDAFTGQVFIRARGRQMAFKVSSAQLGCRWQLGTPRLDVRQDARR